MFGGRAAVAQNSRITGQVSDGQGGVIPGATVEVVSQDSSIKREAKSDESGNYSIPYLPAGQYQIFVRSQGFSSLASPMITLSAGKPFVFNAALTIASEKTEVEVTAAGETTTVDMESASLSTVLSSKEVTGYGLNGRNFSQLLSLAPGVSNQTGQDEAKVGVAGSAKFSVNGGRVEYNTFEVDGSDVLNTSINASRGQGEPLIVYPSIDAIQEMKVLTADYSALYGKSASGSVLVTTKSGSDKFHGSIYEFLRNEMFNARNYFDAPGRTPLYRRQDFGGTIGGPLFIPHIYNSAKTKTFFFWSEEMRLEKTPVAYNQAVPTLAERSGDFSDVCPALVLGGKNTLDRSANPDCPSVGSNPVAPTEPAVSVGYTSSAILNTGLIPLPNSNVGCNTTNPIGMNKCYIASVSPKTYWREELFRIDHKLTASQQLSFRYVHDAWNTTTLAPQWGVVHNSFPTVENLLTGPGLNMETSLAGTLPRGFINRASASYTVQHIGLTPQAGPGLNTLQRPTLLNDPGQATGWSPIANNNYCGTQTGTGSQTPLTGCAMGHIFNTGNNGNRMPGLVFQGNNGAYGGHGFAVDTGYAPWHQANPTYSLRDDVSKTIGNHTLQFGVLATLVQQNEDSAVSGANSGDTQGLLTFSNEQSRYTTGNVFADFLAGPNLGDYTNNKLYQTGIKSFTQDSGQARYYTRYKEADLYLQDDWHVNQRLTLNVGFRASLFGAWYNASGMAYNWRPEAYDKNLAATVSVDPTYGYLVNNNSGSPVLLNPASISSNSPIRNGLKQCGTNGAPKSCMTSRLFYPGPRLGLSYDPFGDGKTAIHGGYGLFWEHGTGYEANVGSLIGGAPLILSATQSNFQSYNDIGYSCQGGSTQCGSSVIPSTTSSIGASFPLNVSSIPTHAVYSYTQQWSLSIQRELKKNLVAQVAYVGTKGTHLTAVRDLNQLQPLDSAHNPFTPGVKGISVGQPITALVCEGGALPDSYFPTSGINVLGSPVITSSPGIGSTSPGYTNAVVACTGNPGFVEQNSAITTVKGTSADTQRPYPGFSNIISVENVADSEYSAFQGTLRETTGSLTLGIAYTFSHSLDDSSDRSSANFANSLDIHSNHASSDFDQRQLLNISYIYDLPLLKWLSGFTHLLGNSSDVFEDAPSDTSNASTQTVPSANTALGAPAFAPLVKSLLGGWQLSGITTFQSGTPFSVVNGGDANGTGPADNAGVGDGLGIGSYPDVIGGAHGTRPHVAPGLNEGPLLLNPGAFAAPSGLTFGNAGRNYLNNPSRTNFNMSLLKHFTPFGAGRDVEFRAEVFNVFNHTQFRITDPSHPGNTGNNVISCYGKQSEFYSAGASSCLAGNSFLHPVDAHDPRIMQFGLKASF